MPANPRAMLADAVRPTDAQCPQAFCAKLQAVLHQHSRAVLRLGDAVADRRSADAWQAAQSAWPVQVAASDSPGTTLLELAAHTHALRVGPFPVQASEPCSCTSAWQDGWPTAGMRGGTQATFHRTEN